jgi:hypothetical protein
MVWAGLYFIWRQNKAIKIRYHNHKNRLQNTGYIAVSAPRGCTGDEGLAPRTRLAGAGFKAPQAALVKSHCGER